MSEFDFSSDAPFIKDLIEAKKTISRSSIGLECFYEFVHECTDKYRSTKIDLIMASRRLERDMDNMLLLIKELTEMDDQAKITIPTEEQITAAIKVVKDRRREERGAS